MVLNSKGDYMGICLSPGVYDDVEACWDKSQFVLKFGPYQLRSSDIIIMTSMVYLEKTLCQEFTQKLVGKDLIKFLLIMRY